MMRRRLWLLFGSHIINLGGGISVEAPASIAQSLGGATTSSGKSAKNVSRAVTPVAGASTSAKVGGSGALAPATTAMIAIPSELSAIVQSVAAKNTESEPKAALAEFHALVPAAVRAMIRIDATFRRSGFRSTGVLAPESLPSIWSALAQASSQMNAIRNAVSNTREANHKQLRALIHHLADHTMRVLDLVPCKDLPIIVASMRACSILSDSYVCRLSLFITRDISGGGATAEHHAAPAALRGCATLPAKSPIDGLGFPASRQLLSELGNLSMEGNFNVHRAAHTLAREMLRGSPSSSAKAEEEGASLTQTPQTWLQESFKSSEAVCGLVCALCKYSIVDDRLISLVQRDLDACLRSSTLFMPHILFMLRSFAVGPVSGQRHSIPLRQQHRKGRTRPHRRVSSEHEQPVELIFPLVSRAVELLNRRLSSLVRKMETLGASSSRKQREISSNVVTANSGTLLAQELTVAVEVKEEQQNSVSSAPTRPLNDRTRSVFRATVHRVLWEPLLKLLSIHCQLNYPNWLEGHQLIMGLLTDTSGHFLRPPAAADLLSFAASVFRISAPDVFLRVLRPILKRNTPVPPSPVLSMLFAYATSRYAAFSDKGLLSKCRKNESRISSHLDRRTRRVRSAVNWIFIAAVVFPLNLEPHSSTPIGLLPTDAAVMSSYSLMALPVASILLEVYVDLSPTGFAAALVALASLGHDLPQAAQVQLVNHFTASAAPALDPAWYCRSFHAICRKFPHAIDEVSLHRWSSRFASSHDFLVKLTAKDLALALAGLGTLYNIFRDDALQGSNREPHWREVALGKRALLTRVLAITASIEDPADISILATALQFSHLFYAPIFSRFCRRVLVLASAVDWASSLDGVEDALKVFHSLAVEFVSRVHKGTVFEDLWALIRGQVIEHLHLYPAPLVVQCFNVFSVLDVTDHAIFSMLVVRLRALVGIAAQETGRVPPAAKADASLVNSDLVGAVSPASVGCEPLLRQFEPSALAILLRQLLAEVVASPAATQSADQESQLPGVDHVTVALANGAAVLVRSQVRKLYPTELVTLLAACARALSLSSDMAKEPGSADLSGVPDLALVHAVYDACREILLSTYGSLLDHVTRRRSSSSSGPTPAKDDQMVGQGEERQLAEVIKQVDEKSLAVPHYDALRGLRIDSAHFIDLVIAISDSGLVDRPLARICSQQISNRAFVECSPGTLVQLLLAQCVQFATSVAPSTTSGGQNGVASLDDAEQLAVEEEKRLRNDVLRPCLDFIWKRAEQLSLDQCNAVERALVHFFGDRVDGDLLARLEDQRKVLASAAARDAKMRRGTSHLRKETRRNEGEEGAAADSPPVSSGTGDDVTVEQWLSSVFP
jgi:hypothetical protein